MSILNMFESFAPLCVSSTCILRDSLEKKTELSKYMEEIFKQDRFQPSRFILRGHIHFM